MKEVNIFLFSFLVFVLFAMFYLYRSSQKSKSAVFRYHLFIWLSISHPTQRPQGYNTRSQKKYLNHSIHIYIHTYILAYLLIGKSKRQKGPTNLNWYTLLKILSLKMTKHTRTYVQWVQITHNTMMYFFWKNYIHDTHYLCVRVCGPTIVLLFIGSLCVGFFLCDILLLWLGSRYNKKVCCEIELWISKRIWKLMYIIFEALEFFYFFIYCSCQVLFMKR